MTSNPVEQDVGTTKNGEREREERPGGGRGAYIGNRVSKMLSKTKKELFCEENHIKKVVQFQNGIFPK